MKLKTLSLVTVICLSSSLVAAEKAKEERIYDNKKQLSVRVTNNTGIDLDKVAVTFRFYESRKELVGEKEDSKFIEGTLTAELEDGKGLSFNSDNAIYNGAPAKEYFGRKSYYVVLYKVSAGRLRIPGTTLMLRSTRKIFKQGTQKQLDFKIISTKNRFGFPVYRIQTKQELRAQ